MRAEISYDVEMDDDNPFVEGTFRLQEADWQVVIVSAFDRDVPSPEIIKQKWDSGVTGVFIRMPQDQVINAGSVEQLLSDTFGVTEWVRVKGPDSMILR